MSKELTEQWRNGTLEEGLYYIEGKGNYDIALIRNRYCPVLTSPYCEDNVFEPDFVPVAPVPTYDQFVELTEKVHILNEANMNLENIIGNFAKQLKEANEVIESLRTYDFTVDDENAEHYQVKWNVEAKRFYKNRK